jgi:hypothetical protein
LHRYTEFTGKSVHATAAAGLKQNAAPKRADPKRKKRGAAAGTARGCSSASGAMRSGCAHAACTVQRYNTRPKTKQREPSCRCSAITRAAGDADAALLKPTSTAEKSEWRSASWALKHYWYCTGTALRTASERIRLSAACGADKRVCWDALGTERKRQRAEAADS